MERIFSRCDKLIFLSPSDIEDNSIYFLDLFFQIFEFEIYGQNTLRSSQNLYR